MQQANVPAFVTWRSKSETSSWRTVYAKSIWIYICISAHTCMDFIQLLFSKRCNMLSWFKTKRIEQTKAKSPSPPRDVGAELKKGSWLPCLTLFCSSKQTHSKSQLLLSPVLWRTSWMQLFSPHLRKKLFSRIILIKNTFASEPGND